MKHAYVRYALFLVTVTALLFPRPAAAHCDTLAGPVVADARRALQSGDPTPVLKWVKPENEAVILDAFARALSVRAQGPEARELADQFFFETLVRIHRAGEGAPYTGLKPAEAVDPVTVESDRALASGDADALAAAIEQGISRGVRQRFARVLEAKKHASDSVEAGRAYVEAYVEFTHYVERLHTAAGATGEHAAHTH